MDALAENGGCLLGACDCNDPMGMDPDVQTELCEMVAFGRPRCCGWSCPADPGSKDKAWG